MKRWDSSVGNIAVRAYMLDFQDGATLFPHSKYEECALNAATVG